MSLVSVVPRLRSKQSLPIARWHKNSTSVPPNSYTSGASPVGTPSSWVYYLNTPAATPAASPYEGATPAWNPSSRTPLGSPRADGETMLPLPHSRLDHFVFTGGETPTWASTEEMLEMDFAESSDLYGKLSSFSISTR